MTTVSTRDPDGTKRSRVSQSDVPAWSLKDALRVPAALRDQYGKASTRPLGVAAAMDMSPNSSQFRMITGAAVAYGLTDGGAQADLIGLTPLGRRAVAPTEEGDDAIALREAALKPRVMRAFLTKYDGNRLPTESIALNVLEEMGVPATAARRAYAMIIENAQHVGYLREVKGNTYVELGDSVVAGSNVSGADAADGDDLGVPNAVTVRPVEPSDADTGAAARKQRVFITHGRNKEIVAQLKEVLTFGGFTPVVSVETESGAKGVTDKVMGEMQSCGAAVIHVGTEKTLLDSDGTEHKIVNQNVLIEIGAALALYDRRFILLVEQGTDLPSNLQGLYEVRYHGGQLDYDATMKLLKAFNDFRGR
jgi:predicted nucleotide-binding protein